MVKGMHRGWPLMSMFTPQLSVGWGLAKYANVFGYYERFS